MFSPVRIVGSILGALTLVSTAAVGKTDDVFVPSNGVVIVGPNKPTDAQVLAVNHFAERMERYTGRRPSVCWGEAKGKHALRIVVGCRAGMADLFASGGWDALMGSKDPDIRSQSYVISTVGRSSGRAITVAGYGEGETPRSSLGLSYGLAELIRRLDLKDGKWGFTLPRSPLAASPAMPHRLLYTADFIDEMIDAGYDQVVLAHVFPTSMYDWGKPDEMGGVLREQQAQRRLIDLARRRGMQVCQYILPPFVRPEILQKHPELQGEGFYNQKPGHGGICWSKPEGRKLIEEYTRDKMASFGPVDIYTVWFYDPGGCFCKECKANQARNIFEQLALVDDAAKVVSPGARVEAVLWPTWCFHEYQTRGIPFTAEETTAFVKDFLGRCAERFGKGKLTIVDSCELDGSNIYNGLVDPTVFPRSGFLYSVMGMPGEQAYRFPPFRFKYTTDEMNLARERGVTTGTLYMAGWLTPTVHTFADALYTGSSDWSDSMRRYAHLVAKGDAYPPFVELLTALETCASATDYASMDSALKQAEALAPKLIASDRLYIDHDWLKAYVLAQRCYLEMARAADEQTFAKWFDEYKTRLGAIPQFSNYAAAMSRPLVVNSHLANWWRGPVGDKSTIGLAPETTPSVAGKVDPRTGDRVDK